MRRRDLLRLSAMTGGLWVLNACATAEKGAAWPNHPFLRGNFAPVQEEITADTLKVIGRLPPEMDGMFVRNGPNPQFPPLGHYGWFTGDGMLHGVRVQGGQASYRNRYVRTARRQEEHAASRSLYDRFHAPPEKHNKANTALIWHAGRALALYEEGPPHHIINAQGDIVSTTPIALPRPIMMHDFAITPRYTLFMDLPAVWTGPVGSVKFAPELGARIGILPRHGTGNMIKWFETSPCYVFHTLNAHQDGDEVVLVACRFSQGLGGPPGYIFEHVFLHQWRFNLKTGRATEGPLDDRRTEFPRISEALTGTRARFGYCGSAGGDMFDGLIKYDLTKGTSEHHAHGTGRMGGEGVFVPRPAPTSEDDGWLVAHVHDAASGKSEFVVVESREFRAPPVARVLLPVRVPYGFHGAWIPGPDLARQRP
jgi:carotenoid cleavage dioxygenase